MATQLGTAPHRLGAPAKRVSVYDWVSDGFVNGLFFRVLLLVAPVQSVLLTPIQGSTAAFLLVLLAPAILVGNDPRYMRLLAFYISFVMLYAIYLALSLSGYLIDIPDMSRLQVIREVYISGYLKQTHLTQGIYLFAAAAFCYLCYVYYKEPFLKFAFFGVLFLACYGFYEFVYYAIFHSNGDILSNRNFGDLDTAAAGAGDHKFATGSMVQGSTLFGSGFMRLKSLTGEPSMYALTVTPFAVYAYARRWWALFGFLTLSLVLSTSTTAVLGLAVGIGYAEVRQRQEFILYIAGALIVGFLLYETLAPFQHALDTLLFEKLDTRSGDERISAFMNHVKVVTDGNIIRFLFGLGFGSIRSTDMLSNLLANVGVIGTFTYFSVILAPCFRLKRGPDSGAIVATLLSIFAMELLTVSEYSYLPPWFMVALGYARVRQQRLVLLAPGQ
ncbi:hypothetical protein [Sphingomonas sp. ACRSK]|uniref:hypothetical protein n=1 Tax=Sphingomonas sp. ACRSK TaxID=2918213 RepID=UPI001EF63D24|nr:hypothetical protein [Sphingomonas sp. ACRSK]MCG7349498.1 hypothetical protein [Sphingomonas sp. ACRSK]